MSDQIIDIDEDGKVTALPDFTTDRKALCERIIELKKRWQEWQIIANDHIIAVRTVTEQLQSMHDAWNEKANALVGDETEQNRRKRSHDNGYAGGLFQAAAEVNGLLKAIRQWPSKVRPHDRGGR